VEISPNARKVFRAVVGFTSERGELKRKSGLNVGAYLAAEKELVDAGLVMFTQTRRTRYFFLTGTGDAWGRDNGFIMNV
jgi:hypothetical protein